MGQVESNKTDDGARRCEACGAAFVCDIAAGRERCWCFDLPNVVPVREGASCLCPGCLKKLIDRGPREGEDSPAGE